MIHCTRVKERGINVRTIEVLAWLEIYIQESSYIVSSVTKGLIDDEQGGFRAGRGCVDHIFTLKWIDERAIGKKTQCMWVLQIWRS